jgi:hypothetical protein
MATELPITFSPGQEVDNKSVPDVSQGVGDKPVLEFSARDVLRVGQISPFTEVDTFSGSATPKLTTTAQRVDPQIPTGAVRPHLKRAIQMRGPSLQTRQLWEGTVTKVLESSFVARLSDKTERSNPNEQALFNFDEVSLDDRRLIRAGSSFYWVIGTEQTPAGQIRNVSMLRFRRVPSWTRSALESAADRASRVREVIWSEE